MGDGGFGGRDGCFCRAVAVVLWTGGLPVHAAAADECSLAAVVACAGEVVGGGHVDGSKVGGTGCSMRQCAGDDLVVRGRHSRREHRAVRDPEGLFQRKGVCLEPVEERRRSENTGIGVLGGMDMSVFISSVHLLSTVSSTSVTLYLPINPGKKNSF